jgi:hypothetical protein
MKTSKEIINAFEKIRDGLQQIIENFSQDKDSCLISLGIIYGGLCITCESLKKEIE